MRTKAAKRVGNGYDGRTASRRNPSTSPARGRSGEASSLSRKPALRADAELLTGPWPEARNTGELGDAGPDFRKLRSLVDQDNEPRQKLRKLMLLPLVGMLVAGLWYIHPGESNPPSAPGTPSVAEVSAAPTTMQDEPAVPTPARAKAVLPASVARAAAVVFSDGRQVGRGGHYDVRFTREARRALESVGVAAPRRSSSAASREAALVRGLGRLVETLGTLEGGIACLRARRELVEAALDLAYGANLSKPGTFESFSRYLPASAKSRAEGPTRRVMALALGYDMQWPVPEVARVSSPFGHRIHPVLGEPMWHTGTDLAVETGTPIYAMADGEVLYSRKDAVNGNFVKLDHGYGLTSAYVHNSKLLVKAGEFVTQGQVIALSGATGRATGPHLHFQVEIDDLPIDPEAFRERKAPRAHRRSIEAEAIGEAHLPH